MIDLGFVIASFVPLVLLWIGGMGYLRMVWRVTLGLGTIPPLILLYFRIKVSFRLRSTRPHPFFYLPLPDDAFISTS